MKTLIERFWAKVNKIDGGCWEWTGKIKCGKAGGYGILSYVRDDEIRLKPNGKRMQTDIRAHRLSWEIHNGEIPANLIVCHHCDNRKCVRPEHLFLGTQQDNLDDMSKKRRSTQKRTPEEVRNIRELYKSGNYSQEEIARLFETSQSRISAIIRRTRYKFIK